MSLTADYYDLKELARLVRAENGLTSTRVLQTDLRRIYFKHGIEIDYWPYRFKSLRGAFLYDELGATVMLACNLPNDPLVFTMAHELKHYLTDRHLTVSYCDLSNADKRIEVEAEVFASELLFPDQMFIEHMREMRVRPGACNQETVVKLKLETKTTLSYAGLAIKAERLGYAPRASLTRSKGWRTIEKVLRNRT